MTTESTDPMAVAEAMMKERRETVKALAKLNDEDAALRAKIVEVGEQMSDAYELAIAAGWSQSELKKMGFTRKGGGRRAKKSSDSPASVTPITGEQVSA